MSNKNNELRAPEASSPVSKSKRALLKAAWVAPVIVAVSLPESSFAANVSGGSGGSTGSGICAIQNPTLIQRILQWLSGC